MDLVGKVLADRYEIREEIGKGGMARVYRAWCHLLNRYVAIKVLKEEYKDDKEFVHRFNVEAQAAAGISNPHVVSIYDVGIENGLYYIVMEYIEGITLKEYIAEKGCLPWRMAAKFAAQICEGLAAAHKANVVHRDIKPQNIIMTPEGILKVTDFGIARASGQTTTTMGGSAIGTVHYLSPEQARGGYTDQRTDVYSLGIVLYEMLTGKLPFTDESPVAVAIKHIQESPTPLREINPDIPVSVEMVTLRAMAKEQSKRYASAEEFLRDLETVLRNPDYPIGNMAGVLDVDDDMGSTIKMVGIDDKAIEKYEERKRTQAGPRTGRTGRAGRSGNLPKTEASELREIDERRQQRDQKKKERQVTWMAILAAVLVIAILGFVMVGLTGGGLNIFQNSETVKIPNLIDMEIEKAQHEYKDTFSIVKRAEKQSDKKAGIILEQSPEEGEKVRKRDDMVIYVVVSAGNETTTLESYVDAKAEEAQKALKDAGFQVNVIEQASDSTEEGKVIAQEPAAGSTISKGGLVTIYVSKGSAEEEPTETPTPTATSTQEPEKTSEPTVTAPTQTPTSAPTKDPDHSGGVTAPGIGD